MPEPTEAEIDQDFASALRRGGVRLEPDRIAGMRESYVRYLDLVRVLADPLAYTEEPVVAMHLRPTPVAGETTP